MKAASFLRSLFNPILTELHSLLYYWPVVADRKLSVDILTAEKSHKGGAKPGEMLIKLRIRFYQVQCGRFRVRA